MCGSENKQTTTETNNYPSWATDYMKKTTDTASAIADKPYKYNQNYGDYVAPLHENQQKAIYTINADSGDMYYRQQGLRDQAQWNMNSYMYSPASQVGMQAVNAGQVQDRRGDVGSIQSYMDPYVQSVLGNTITNIQDAGKRQRNDIGAGATMAGAFGDARHGVVEASQMRDEGRNIGEAANRAYSDAFKDATGRQQYDLNYLAGIDTGNVDRDFSGQVHNSNQYLDVGKTNAALYEQMLERLRTGTNDMIDQQGRVDDQYYKMLSALMESGQTAQQTDQAYRDEKKEEDRRAYEDQYRKLDALNSVLSGATNSQTGTTSTTRSSDNWGSSAIGSLLSMLFG